jgi:hypothetical protein
MIGLAAMALAAVLGAATIWRYAGLRVLRPRWAAWLLAFGAGTAFGLGATSILWLLAASAAPSARLGVLAIEIGALGWMGFAIRREGAATDATTASAPRAPGVAVAAALLAVAVAAVVAQQAPGWQANPQGGWDAWSIWNLRAKFLAAPDGLAARAWSPLLSATHPEYPLLTAGAIGRAWGLGGGATPDAPIALSLLFFLSLLASTTGAIAAWRGPASGLLAGLALAGTPALSMQAVSQYADVPLAAYFAAAIGFAMLDRPLWAGVFAGMAAWTKDEGALFCAVLVAAFALLRRGGLARLAVGLAPAAAVYTAFKLLLAPHLSTHTGSGALARLFDVQRYSAVAAGAARDFWGLGLGWYHPILPLAVFAAALGLRKEAREQAWLCTAAAGLTLAGYLAFVTATPDNLQWQIDTALGRLFVQWWPLAVFAVMAWTRSPEETVVTAAPPEPAPASRKSARGKRAKP